jgi:4-coumarate--CoA ligase
MFAYPEHDTSGSVGRFLPNLDIKLLDDAGVDVTGRDVRGELAIWGRTVTLGYLRRARDANFDKDGDFRTGDVLFCTSKMEK